MQRGRNSATHGQKEKQEISISFSFRLKMQAIKFNMTVSCINICPHFEDMNNTIVLCFFLLGISSFVVSISISDQKLKEHWK